MATPKEEQFRGWDANKDYDLVRIVGTGSYGSVAEAVHRGSGRKVAVKRMQGLFEDEEDCKKMVRELLLLRHLNSPYVTKLLDIA